MKKSLSCFGVGSWIQFVFQCRVNPNSITKIRGETLAATCKIDPNYSNSEVEWLIGDGEIIEDPTSPLLPKTITFICSY